MCWVAVPFELCSIRTEFGKTRGQCRAHWHHLTPCKFLFQDDDDDDGSDGFDDGDPEDEGATRLDVLNRRQHEAMLRCIKEPTEAEQVSKQCALVEKCCCLILM